MASDSICAADRREISPWASGVPKANIVVSPDGTNGAYKSITAALEASLALRKDTTRFVVHVRRGTYVENVVVTRSMVNITIVGDGIEATIVTGNKNCGHDGTPTFLTATFIAEGDGFVARDMTFVNTAGSEKGQAVAFRSSSLHSVCYRCSFKGYQDTLYVHSGKQFYRECDIYGTVDFIFGDAAAVLQNCNIYVRKPTTVQHEAYITAQSRKAPNGNTGTAIHNSKIMATPELIPVLASTKVYLGRPWGDYSRTAVLKTFIDGLIDPAGWSDWEDRKDTLYYGEYLNTGEGANTQGRPACPHGSHEKLTTNTGEGANTQGRPPVCWHGYHEKLTTKEAEAFTVENLLGGSSWLPATGVPFTPGL